MKAKDVVIGEKYVAKVSGNLVVVRITGDAGEIRVRGGYYRSNGWHAVNTLTGRAVRIKTAGRLRRNAETNEAGKS